MCCVARLYGRGILRGLYLVAVAAAVAAAKYYSSGGNILAKKIRPDTPQLSSHSLWLCDP